MRDSVQHEKITAEPTVVSLLSMRAEQQPHRVAYTFAPDDGSRVDLTYSELDQQARAIAGQLAELGAGARPVLLLYPSGVDYLAAFFGCLCAGAIAVPVCPPDPLQPDQSLARLAAVVRDVMPSAVLTTAPVAAGIRLVSGISPELARLPVITTCDGPADGPPGRPSQLADDSTAVLLQYTAGATLAPPGMTLSHRDLMGNSELIFRFFGLGPDSRWVSWLPLHHEMGLMGGVVLPLYGGFPVTVIPPASFGRRPLSWLREISRTRATVSGGPDSAYELCVQQSTAEERCQLDLSSWRVAFSDSEPLRAETMDNFARAFAPAGFRRDAFHSCDGLELTAERGSPVPAAAGQHRFDRPVTLPASAEETEVPAAPDIPGLGVPDQQAIRLYCWVGGSRVPVHSAASTGAFADPRDGRPDPGDGRPDPGDGWPEPGDGRPGHGLRRMSRSADAVVPDLRRLGHGSPARRR
jgi:acyl-CoA synthetase (AMP-forming)/AMP-acid ligase II